MAILLQSILAVIMTYCARTERARRQERFVAAIALRHCWQHVLGRDTVAARALWMMRQRVGFLFETLVIFILDGFDLLLMAFYTTGSNGNRLVFLLLLTLRFQ